MSGPNPIRVALATLKALRVSPPTFGDGVDVDHSAFEPILATLAESGGLATVNQNDVYAYVAQLTSIVPESLGRDHALAYWINVYNALAVALAKEADESDASSVLDIRSGFHRRVVHVAGEALSLIDIEHGKIRRFRDPRIHAALVCGSLSCPTLRPVPFVGVDLDRQLDEQMRHFLSAGGLVIDRTAGTVSLSRVFLWYGTDFVRPMRMPSFVPVSRSSVLRSLLPWLSEQDQRWAGEATPKVSFQDYDWGLGCAVA